MIYSQLAVVDRGPDGLKKLVGLATKKCTSCEGKDATPLDPEQANKLRNQVPGWQITQATGGHLSLRQDWKVIPVQQKLPSSRPAESRLLMNSATHLLPCIANGETQGKPAYATKTDVQLTSSHHVEKLHSIMRPHATLCRLLRRAKGWPGGIVSALPPADGWL